MKIISTLLGYMTRDSRRQQIKPLLKDMMIDAPFDELIQVLMSVDGDLVVQDIMTIATDVLPPTLIRKLDIPEYVSTALGQYAINQLISLNKIKKIGDILKGKGEPIDKVIGINKLTALNLSVPEPTVKLSTELQDTESASTLRLLDYDLDRGYLVLIAAYAGMGKTTLSLCIAKDALLNDLKVLYIAIEDWTETTLKRKISEVDIPPFYVAIYPSCGLSQIEADINYCQPDLCIVDSMTVVEAMGFEKKYEKHGEVASQLRRLAQEKNLIMLTTHQLTNFAEYVTPDDLQDGKSHILAHVDVGLGIGAREQWSQERTASTIKLRHQKHQAPIPILLNHDRLQIKRIDI